MGHRTCGHGRKWMQGSLEGRLPGGGHGRGRRAPCIHSQGCWGLTLPGLQLGREDCPSLSRPDTPTPKWGSRWVLGGLPKWRKWGSHWLRAGATMQTGQDGRPWDRQCQDTW